MIQLGILLLAAGGSTRMGRPKALLPLGETTLIQNRLAELAKVPAVSRMVVLGGHYPEIASVCAHPDWHIFHHAEWGNGMGTSVAAGVNQTLPLSHPSHILIALLDQPYLQASHFLQLWNAAKDHPEKIIAAEYNKTLGAPAIFPSHYFPILGSLSGDQGARKIIQQHLSNVVILPMPEGEKDWDTPLDLVDA